MRMGQLKNLLIVMLMITTGLSAMVLVTSENGEAFGPPPAYHNGFIHLNVMTHDGSPAENHTVYWRSHYVYNGISVKIDASGDAVLNLTFFQIGYGWLSIVNMTSETLYKEFLNVDPDAHIYRNLTLPSPRAPVNVITGIIRNQSTNDPMPGVEIRLTSETELGDQIRIYNTTDQDGRYRFEIPDLSDFFIQLYIASFWDLQSNSKLFFLKEGVHLYENDFVMTEREGMEMVSRIRFLDENEDVIDGSVSVTTLSIDDQYQSMSGELDPMETDGWKNYTTSQGEVNVYFHPSSKLIPRSSTVFHYYFLQNGTSQETEIMIDFSNYVPVEIVVSNSSGTIDGASLYCYHRATREFGIYSAEYSNGTDVNGKAIVMLPPGGVYRVSSGKANHDSGGVYADTTGPGPYEFSITLEQRETPRIPPKANINITLVDYETGLPVPNVRVHGSGSYDGEYYGFEGYTDPHGLLSMQVDAIEYNSISGEINLGTGRVEDHQVISGEPNNITLKLIRRESLSFRSGEKYHFYVFDQNGQPAPNISIEVSGRVSGNHYYGSDLVSDDQGRIDLVHVPESELVISTPPWLDGGSWNPWVIQKMRLIPSETDMRLPDVTIYPRFDLSPITGFIRDSESMEPLVMTEVKCRSVKPMEPSRFYMSLRSDYLDGLEYMDMTRHSNKDGFYRVHGVETAILEVHQEGYFVYMEEVQVDPTRSDIQKDILLESLPAAKAWLNGTLVDKDGSPISGELNITDISHPGESGHDIIINETGMFSIQLWPSNYRLNFFNETLDGTMDVELTTDGIQNLELMLIPYSKIHGTVLGWNGLPVEGINVTLQKQGLDAPELIDWFITGADGHYSLMALEGTYFIVIEGNDQYGYYTVADIQVNGWDSWFSNLYLLNRTNGALSGTVLGTAGPYADGVPGVTLAIMSNGTEIYSVISNSTGYYEFDIVNFGTYDLVTTPSESMQPVVDLRSGYLVNDTEFTMNGAMVTKDPVLEYVVYTPSQFVDVDFRFPNGTGVYLDELVTIEFSLAMNKTATEGAISIDPSVDDLAFTWDTYNRVLTISHADLAPDTLYTVTIGTAAVSWEGYPLQGEEAFVWSFTTGNITNPWSITTAAVTLDGMELTVNVTAPENQTLYISISNVGYFLVEELGSGEYEIVLTELTFSYETLYYYFFTDVMNGVDKAPQFSGTFMTPEAPLPEWKLTDATVETLVGGDWKVRVDGNEGIVVYIVIDGVGSFKLQNMGSGEYGININYTEFEKGETYDYYFSDTPDGEDLAPTYSGSATDQRSETTVGTETPWGLITILIVIILLLIIGICVVALVLAGRKKEDEGWGDEE